MRALNNECGIRNGFGYYDYKLKEIVLKRPCTQKADWEDVCNWLDDAADLKRFSIGIGALENFVSEGVSGGLYSSARLLMKNTMGKSKYTDAEMLKQILGRLTDKQNLRNLAIKCCIFYDDTELFDLLIDVISALPKLVYLDLTGCYFSDEQLIDLSIVIAKMKISHLVWPEPRMDRLVLSKVIDNLKPVKSLVILSGVPLEMQVLAQEHREALFALGRRPSLISEAEAASVYDYRDSIELAIAYEKQKLYELEKTFQGLLAGGNTII